MEKNEGRTELWLFPTDGGRAKRLTAGDKDSEPSWSPDGRSIAFLFIEGSTQEPGALVASETKRAEASSTSTRP